MPQRTASKKERAQTAETAVLALQEIAADCKAAGFDLLAKLIGAAELEAREEHENSTD